MSEQLQDELDDSKRALRDIYALLTKINVNTMSFENLTLLSTIGTVIVKQLPDLKRIK